MITVPNGVMVRDKGIPSLWYEQDEFWDDSNAPEDYFHNNRKLNLIHCCPEKISQSSYYQLTIRQLRG